MAFDFDNLKPISQDGTDLVDYWLYTSSDSEATIKATDYFLDARLQLSLNDVIKVVASAGGTPAYFDVRISSISASSVTVEAIGNTFSSGDMSFGGDVVLDGLVQLPTSVLVLDDSLGVRFTSNGLNTGTKRGRIDFSSDGGFNIRNGASETLTVKVLGNGNVGLGNDSPSYKLDVTGTAHFTGAVQLGVSGAASGVVSAFDELFFNIDSDNNSSSNSFRFGTNRSGTSGGTELMRLNESGNLGIGNTTIDAKLDVNGEIAIVDGMTAPSATSGKAKIFVDSADGDLKIIFGDGTTKTIVTDT